MGQGAGGLGFPNRGAGGDGSPLKLTRMSGRIERAMGCANDERVGRGSKFEMAGLETTQADKDKSRKARATSNKPRCKAQVLASSCEVGNRIALQTYQR